MCPKPDAHPPADDVELLEIIRQFVAEAGDIPILTVDPDINIYETLGVDSLGAMCIFIDISYEFGIPEPGEGTDFSELNSVRKILGYIRTQEAKNV